jgi:hypothetical protein
MTASTIHASFEQTGVIPFNPSVVTPKMMAPSLMHSSKGSLPIPLTSPVKRVMRYHDILVGKSQAEHIPATIHPSQDVNMFAHGNVDDADSDANSDIMDWIDHITSTADPAQSQQDTPIAIDPFLLDDRQVADALAVTMESSSASILISLRPLPAEYQLPESTYGPMPDLTLDLSFMHAPTPTTLRNFQELVCKMRTVLEVYEECENQARYTISALNAQVALGGMVVNKAQLQLSNKAKRDAKKMEKETRIPSNGLASLITHPALANNIEENNKEKEEEEEAKKQRSDANGAWKTFSKPLKEALKKWQAQKKCCKDEGILFQGGPKPQIPKKMAWMVEQGFGNLADDVQDARSDED